jgi:hypothetical protein
METQEIADNKIMKFETEYEAIQYSKLVKDTMVIKEVRYGGYYVMPKIEGVFIISNMSED